jgi:hypothetical protein
MGFGSGIYGGKHHADLLDLADHLPRVTDRNAFIFSTSAITGKAKIAKDHATLKKKLQCRALVSGVAAGHRRLFTRADEYTSFFR